MELKEKIREGNFIFSAVKQFFHAVSLTFLSLLLPLSFLLLARLTSPPSSILNSIILYILTFLSLSSLLYSITGHSLSIKPQKAIAWAFLCLFQACTTFGIEATIRAGFKPLEDTSRNDHETLVKRTFLFVGIYELMMLWRRMFVKLVVDDTVYGEERKEQGIDRSMMAAAFSAFWLWLLQREVEPLVLAAGRGGLRKAVSWSGFIIWLVSFTTVMTGIVRVVEVLLWLLSQLLQLMKCRGEQETDRHAKVANEV